MYDFTKGHYNFLLTLHSVDVAEKEDKELNDTKYRIKEVLGRH